eukprot:evm.model.NODE_47661_length_12524_cov_19.198978.4
MEWTRSFFTSAAPAAPVPAASDAVDPPPPPPGPDPKDDFPESPIELIFPPKRLRPDAKNVAYRLALRRELGRRLPAGLQETPQMLERLPERHRVHGYVVALNKALDAYVAAKYSSVPSPSSTTSVFAFPQSYTLEEVKWQQVRNEGGGWREK